MTFSFRPAVRENAKLRDLLGEVDALKAERAMYRIEADCAMRDYDALELAHGELEDRLEQAEVDTERKVDADLRAQLEAAEGKVDTLKAERDEWRSQALAGNHGAVFVRAESAEAEVARLSGENTRLREANHRLVRINGGLRGKASDDDPGVPSSKDVRVTLKASLALGSIILGGALAYALPGRRQA